ncbi:SMI1/KNR4 family protein [Paenibacillus sp. MMS18-CY102]|uniref:SMI1/KNR4 family protein n=1 Tax=Paenibacillus sp. MMS18-CY102 TaxID=2682849 RepID=UPI0013661D98|nr:SMI1/KNR4 family protein [Paenibacillus sp. MMS18-CY102]MWC29860.1 hypothetical protein [Paenibacillus sp. MMS18-CY102]
MNQALALVNSEKRRRREDFCKRLSKKELNDNNFHIPTNWIELLKKTNGGCLSTECELVPLNDIQTFTREKLKEGKGFDEEYSDNRISIAVRGDGDWYDLVLIDDYSCDCPVFQVTHEGGGILREWENIASFIYDMIVEEVES